MTELCWKRNMRHEGTPVLALELCCPEFSGETAAQRRLARYYRACFNHWRSRWEGFFYTRACGAADEARAQGLPFRPWEAGLTYRITFDRDGLLSLCLDARETTGHGRTLLVRTAQTWDLDRGVPLPLSRFLTKGQNRRWPLLRELENAVEARCALGETLLDEAWRQELPGSFRQENFYLTEEGIAVFFPMYTIAPYAEGIPVFLLPGTAPAAG